MTLPEFSSSDLFFHGDTKFTAAAWSAANPDAWSFLLFTLRVLSMKPQLAHGTIIITDHTMRIARITTLLNAPDHLGAPIPIHIINKIVAAHPSSKHQCNVFIKTTNTATDVAQYTYTKIVSVD